MLLEKMALAKCVGQNISAWVPIMPKDAKMSLRPTSGHPRVVS